MNFYFILRFASLLVGISFILVSGNVNATQAGNSVKADDIDKIIGQLDAMAFELTNDQVLPDPVRVELLKSKLEALQNQRQLCAREFTSQSTQSDQVVKPVGKLNPSDSPPTEDELEQMAKALDRTYLPAGPSFKTDDESKPAIHDRLSLTDTIRSMSLILVELEETSPSLSETEKHLESARLSLRTYTETSWCSESNESTKR